MIDTLSTVFFNITLNNILNELTSTGTIASKTKQVNAHADDNGQK